MVETFDRRRKREREKEMKSWSKQASPEIRAANAIKLVRKPCTKHVVKFSTFVAKM
jgi:hypothetical protein